MWIRSHYLALIGGIWHSLIPLIGDVVTDGNANSAARAN